MQYSVVNFGKIRNHKDLRFDAEFYKPKYLELEALFQNRKSAPFGKLVKEIRSGPFGSTLLSDTYLSSGVIVVRPFNIKNFTIEHNNLVYIDEKDCIEKGLNFYSPGDVFFSRVGDVRCGVVRDFGNKITISPNIIAAKSDPQKLNPYYAAIFFNTRYGFPQIERGLKIVAQPTIQTNLVADLEIVLLDDVFQKLIEEVFTKYFEFETSSHSLYHQAEQRLLAELDLVDWQPQHQLSFVQNYSEVQAAERFDAEYFQPKYQQAMAILGASGHRIEDFAAIAKRRFESQTNKEFNYIEIAGLSKDGYAESNAIMGEDAPSRAQWVVKSGDIITSTVRPIRSLTALIEPHQGGFVCSSGFAVLRPKDIAPELLLVYLKLPIVCEILDLHTTASMYPAISITDLLNIPITLPASAEE